MRRVIVLSVLIISFAAPARAETGIRLEPPVDGSVVTAFDAPGSEFGPGHRGIDYAVASGTNVRAAAAGNVTFAGRVADVLAVTIDHGSGIETTYTGLERVDVNVGDDVGQGRFVGTSGTVHGRPGLHFGAKVDGSYVDPMSLLTPLDVSAAIHLAPLSWTPDELGVLGDAIAPPATVGTSTRECDPVEAVAAPGRAPNDNVVVAVAGITSKTRGGVSADIYESGPELLGYPKGSTYHFSYAGVDGPRFHRAYERADTYIDIRVAARRLGDLMQRIAQKHPGRAVDLIAHSQGGIVARTFLTHMKESGPDMPVVEHLVTYASPHQGAPGASQLAPLRDNTLTGRYVLDAAARLSARGLPVPDPASPAVAQLAPGSELMTSLAREDTAYGTRVLTLAIPNDPVVPADRALIPGKQGRIVPWTPKGMGPASPLTSPYRFGPRLLAANLGGHSAIVTSPVAHGIAYSFLSDRALTCTTRWDAVGPRIGSVWSALQSSAASIYGALEQTVPAASLFKWISSDGSR